jgi:hypothetical protein
MNNLCNCVSGFLLLKLWVDRKKYAIRAVHLRNIWRLGSYFQENSVPSIKTGVVMKTIVLRFGAV